MKFYIADCFAEEKYQGNELLVVIAGAVHTDLYYKMDVIPFDKIEKFYRANLK